MTEIMTKQGATNLLSVIKVFNKVSESLCIDHFKRFSTNVESTNVDSYKKRIHYIFDSNCFFSKSCNK